MRDTKTLTCGNLAFNAFGGGQVPVMTTLAVLRWVDPEAALCSSWQSSGRFHWVQPVLTPPGLARTPGAHPLHNEKPSLAPTLL